MKITRRQVISGAALAAAAGASSNFGRGLSALAGITVNPQTEKNGDILVVLFLRGGADGLNIVAPHGEDTYYKLRPSLAIARPGDLRSSASARALDLDGFFGLHPALAPLLPFYKEGEFAVVHAVGSGDQTRSHFEAMATMERGLASEAGAASGWLARYLNATTLPSASPLRAVAVSDTMPDSLRGATAATTLTNLADFRLVAPEIVPTGANGQVHHAPSASSRADAMSATLKEMYGSAPGEATESVHKGTQNPTLSAQDSLRSAGKETLAALDAVKRLDPANYHPAAGAVYPEDIIGNGFRQAACLVKGDVGLEIACLEMGGWDTHAAQGREIGWQPRYLGFLGQAIAAFLTDIGNHRKRVTLIVMTEFGRRAYENFSLGTDHGRASCLFAIGGGVHGGKVYSDWPGLKEGQLDGGDLRVTTDYRDVLAEVLARRLKSDHLAEVFPEYSPRFRNIFRELSVS